MLRLHTMVVTLLLCGLVISPGVGASAGDLSPTTVQQVLADNAGQSCINLPALRSADLQVVLTDLYQSNEHEALWQDLQRLAALKAELAELVNDGLEPGDYGFALRATPPADACSELRISSQYLLALEHLSRGRLAQERHEPLWQADALPPASVPTLAQLAITGLREGPRAAFDQARPALPQYHALRAAYAAMDREEPSFPAVLPGPLLRPGMRDERVVQIGRRLQQGGFMVEVADATGASIHTYDEALVHAVRRFQANQGLQADGIIGPLTISAMNISPAQRVRQVQINLERLRWINAQRSDYLLLINVASGHLQLLRGNDPVWQARAQSGRPSRPTPPLVSYINRITLNPSWTVPPTILREDVLPQIRRDREYLDAYNMQALDAQGNLLDPQGVDWNNPQGIILRQPPGPDNPLGQVVFRLPNPYFIYLHDTPRQDLFQQANRNVSSGCIRVEDAPDLAHHLLTGLGATERARIAEQLTSGQTHEISLAYGPVVILAYMTAFADAEGRPAFVPDRYGLDQALEGALSGVRAEPRTDMVFLD